ncbi:MAG TPA: arginine--tRNA ligase [Candidatus Baltobacteraceae bacterium]|nr:arginine--tRNA ligase [Candidatus Baltobacteraceae bacterium]
MLPDDALDAFARAIEAIVGRAYPQAPPAAVEFEAPRRPEFGDFATNVAFSLAKIARRSPNDVANALIEQLRAQSPEIAGRFASIDAVAGFINVRLAPALWQALVAQILRQGADFGRALPRGERISLEFGSANPTGPLVVVQGRTLSIGDTLARAFRFRGYDVFAEWIINDAGSQVETLGRSLYARYMQHYDPSYPFPEDGYPGDYLVALAQAIARRDGEKWRDHADAIATLAKFGRDAIVAEQRATAERFGVHYDLWQSERELRKSGRMNEDLDKLRAMGLIYEADGAQYFRTSEFGDDKDRVIIRSDGSPTYFAPDIAYHFEKLSRSNRAIDILGPDHHGYIGRLKAAAAAMGFPGKLDILIAQQITLMRGGEQVSMSKREGNIITLDEILDEVGVDAARFFFAMLSTDSPLTFDLKLAVEQSSDNPVYYVQYGHARIASVLRRADPADVDAARAVPPLTVLNEPAEIALARRVAELPRVVQGVVDHLAPHRLTKYARDVATEFHQFYAECTILVDERDLRLARLALCVATRSVLAQVLELIGVSAPESM